MLTVLVIFVSTRTINIQRAFILTFSRMLGMSRVRVSTLVTREVQTKVMSKASTYFIIIANTYSLTL